MKAYGVKRQDQSCCPGHNKFSRETYNSRRSKKAQTRDTKHAHGRERSSVKIQTKIGVDNIELEIGVHDAVWDPQGEFCNDYCCTVNKEGVDEDEIIDKYVINSPNREAMKRELAWLDLIQR